MSVAMQHLVYSALANADLTGKLFCFAKVVTNGGSPNVGLIAVATSGDAVIGVIVEEGTSGNPVSVAIDGIAKVTLGATLNAGTVVMSDGSGHAVAYVDSPIGNFAVGILLQDGNSGDVCTVALNKGGNNG